MEIIDRLAEHRMLATVPREELAWLAAHGSLRELEPGDVVAPRDSRVENLVIMLSGCVAMYVDRGGGPHKAMEWHPGDISGVLPYSRMHSPPGASVAQEPSTILIVHRDHFPAMIRECHETTSLLVHVMLDRARSFTSSDLHDEKMLSLGKLSAGLAHELNNPASAIERGAALLGRQIEAAEAATRTLGAARLTDTQLAALDAVREACVAARTHGVPSPLEQAEREDAIADWLAKHGVEVTLADALAETAVTIEALDHLAAKVEGPALDAVLHWAATSCSVRSVVEEIQIAAIRIAALVSAVKGFTHMDQAPTSEPVDVALGLGHTVAVLKAKARGKSAAVVVESAPDLPRARGFVGELNQIWANLIDNALDAIPDAGRVEVTATREQQQIVVRIADNGGGIPKEILPRIFDPFFTTKPLGQGTGLGLDIVRRLVRHNEGEISVASQPGRTEFRVALPIAGDEDNGERA